MIARRVLVEGRVQGVGFRWFVQEAALDLRVGGWVRNLRDGRVELVAEGEDAAVRALVERVRRGPGFARVDRLEEREHAPEGRVDFEVRPTAPGEGP